MTDDMMNAGALIPISENNGKRAVSARDLHTFLESKQEFANWIKNRIEKYDLVENVDYVVFDKSVKNPNGGRPQIEYALTIDAAKELSMVEGNEKGKQARRYFIACEKKLTELAAPSYMIEDPIKRAEKWIEEQKQLKQLAAENEKQPSFQKVVLETLSDLLLEQHLHNPCNQARTNTELYFHCRLTIVFVQPQT